MHCGAAPFSKGGRTERGAGGCDPRRAAYMRSAAPRPNYCVLRDFCLSPPSSRPPEVPFKRSAVDRPCAPCSKSDPTFDHGPALNSDLLLGSCLFSTPICTVLDLEPNLDLTTYVPLENRRPSPRMDSHNPLPAFWEGVGYLMKGSRPPELSLTGKNTSAEAITSHLYLTSRVGRAVATVWFLHMYEERFCKTDVTCELVEELQTKTKEFLQPNPTARAKMAAVKGISKLSGQAKSNTYPQPEGVLGDCMLLYGKKLGEDTVFSQCLIEMGEALKQMADVKYSLDDNIKQSFLEPLHHLQTKDLKEVMHHRKKLQGRRLDFDCKRRRQAKGVGRGSPYMSPSHSGNSQRQGAHIPDDEIRQAEEKFAESLQLAQIGMFNLLDSDWIFDTYPFEEVKIMVKVETTKTRKRNWRKISRELTEKNPNLEDASVCSWGHYRKNCKKLARDKKPARSKYIRSEEEKSKVPFGGLIAALKDAETAIYDNDFQRILRGKMKIIHMVVYIATCGLVALNEEHSERIKKNPSTSPPHRTSGHTVTARCTRVALEERILKMVEAIIRSKAFDDA
ncbi:Endophilin-A [Eumeta japonica]|uniref:Endophilin-A n=1 Tax=Eumeta variegata TaxID=151549 RepID=A0A4C1XMZ5_EUMVA|nr:Endophilin-A [Eumeta japonica]